MQNLKNLLNGLNGQKLGIEKQFRYKAGDLVLALVATVLILVLAAAGGYYLGRKYQIQHDKGVLEMIPDVNCGSKK